MRCEIAKRNLLVINQAIAHYTDSEKRKESPVFRFMSFYSDDEPYPIAELIECVSELISTLEKEFKQKPSDSLAIVLSKWRRQHRALLAVQKGDK